MRRILNTKQNMKRMFLYAALSLVLFSCRNGVETEKESESLAPRPKVAKCIEEAFAYFIKHERNPDTATLYSMSIMNGEPGFAIEDTVICFGRQNIYMSTDGFKGQASIGNYKILVFDNKNIGGSFFNRAALETLALDTLEFPAEASSFDCFIIRSEYLYLRGYQPDDFERIKIDRLDPENP